jgi:uncharacterized protein (TIGR02391 family)
VATSGDLEQYRRANLPPRQVPQPRLAQKLWASFLRSEYYTAVFQAFAEVRVGVRETGGFADTDLGVPLVRKAFDPAVGPRTDTTALHAERETLAHLLAGVLGYKNPHGHRNVRIEPQEAVEMIMLSVTYWASWTVVERRHPVQPSNDAVERTTGSRPRSTVRARVLVLETNKGQ